MYLVHVEGKPTLKAAERLKLKKEAQELNLDNIIASEGSELASLRACLTVVIVCCFFI